MRKLILALCLGSIGMLTQAAHVQWESAGLEYMIPPLQNMAVDDPARGVPFQKDRTLTLTGLSTTFRKPGYIEILAFNNTPDSSNKEAWIEIIDVKVVSGVAKTRRSSGHTMFFVEGNGPVTLDIVARVSGNTDPEHLAVKVRSPYGQGVATQFPPRY